MLLLTQNRTYLLPSYYLSCLPLHISPFQLLTLVILITCLYSLYLPLVYIETLELHFTIKSFIQFLYTATVIVISPDRTTCCTTLFKKSLLLSPLQCLELLYLLNERTIDPGRRRTLTDDERTNQI